MKKLIFLLALIFAALTLQAQQSFHYSHTDTLTNADTLAYVIDITDLKHSDYYYSNHFEADTLSGTAAVTVYFQLSNFDTGDDWYNADTISVSTNPKQDWSTGTLQAVRCRWYMLASGTQSTKIKFATRGVPKK